MQSPRATSRDGAGAVALARGPQPLWAAVPAWSRARYLRRAAQAILDELDDLAALLALHAGTPRTEALLAELLPSVSGLHGLADDGPDALADRRVRGVGALRAARRSVLIQAPVGVVGVRGTPASPWGEPVLEAGAALLAGNAVVLAPPAAAVGERMAGVLARAGLPDGLVEVVASDADLSGCDAETVPAPEPRKATMLVLAGAPPDATVGGALWAAFARRGQGPAAVGAVVAVPGVAGELAARLQAGARRLHVGDPLDPETEIGPLASREDLARVEALVAEAVAGGAELLCGGRLEVAGVDGPFYAPAVLRGVRPDAAVLRERPPGPVLAVVEAESEGAALEICRAAGTSVSVWSGDRGHGERVARALGAETTWVNDHGIAAPAAPVRLARHVEVRQIASQPPNLRSARWLPYDPTLVRASTASARLLHGRESERVRVLRAGAVPLARVAARMVREMIAR